MLTKIIAINNKYGIHARPSSAIAEIVNQYNGTVVIKYNGNETDASSVMNIILLCIEPNSEIELIVDGKDEDILFSKLIEYLEVQLYKDE